MHGSHWKKILASGYPSCILWFICNIISYVFFICDMGSISVISLFHFPCLNLRKEFNSGIINVDIFETSTYYLHWGTCPYYFLNQNQIRKFNCLKTHYFCLCVCVCRYMPACEHLKTHTDVFLWDGILDGWDPLRNFMHRLLVRQWSYMKQKDASSTSWICLQAIFIMTCCSFYCLTNRMLCCTVSFLVRHHQKWCNVSLED